MAYTDNVPQGNQQIATTQPIIQANFQYLKPAINQEHNFDVSDPTKTFHLKASMPNQADPGGLPAGTNGQYYVNGGLPKFYNGTAYQIQLSNTPYSILTGNANITTSTADVVAVPNNTCGTYYLLKVGTDPTKSCAMGQFVASSNILQIGTVSDPNLSISSNGLTIRASSGSSTYNGSYKYLVVYFTP